MQSSAIYAAHFRSNGARRRSRPSVALRHGPSCHHHASDPDQEVEHVRHHPGQALVSTQVLGGVWFLGTNV
jgi:hypothetical protein